jgi:hypothetical protein
LMMCAGRQEAQPEDSLSQASEADAGRDRDARRTVDAAGRRLDSGSVNPSQRHSWQGLSHRAKLKPCGHHLSDSDGPIIFIRVFWGQKKGGANPPRGHPRGPKTAHLQHRKIHFPEVIISQYLINTNNVPIMYSWAHALGVIRGRAGATSKRYTLLSSY